MFPSSTVHFLHYQIDLLKQVPEIDEVILSLNYQPRRIEEIFGDGSDVGIKIRYVVEPAPLGTAGAVKYAGDKLTESVVVFNGDVLTQIDLAAVIRLHRERRRKATIVLTPGGESVGVRPGRDRRGRATSSDSSRSRKPEEITTNRINAGIYVLEPDTFDRIPSDVAWSIERSYFPSLIERGETFVAYVYDGYWIDIGTHEKYVQVHRDIMDGRFTAAPFTDGSTSAGSRPERGSRRARPSPGRASSTRACVIKAGARIGPYTVLGRQTQVEEDAVARRHASSGRTRGSSREASVRDAIVGRNCHLGRNVTLEHGAVLGDRTTLTDFTRF